MDAQQLLDNFETITEAPGGIPGLRTLILDLAVTGKLVPQDPGEEPADVGMKEVRLGKATTLADSIRGGAATVRIPTEAEERGRLPAGWAWSRIDDTGSYVNGLAFKNADWKPTGIPIIRIQNLTNDQVLFNHAEGPFPEERMAQDEDILVSWSATLNAFWWDRGIGVVNQHIFKVIPDERVVFKPYLFHLLRHTISAMAASDSAHGLVMKHINRGPFLSYVVALPPIAEQQRIVAAMAEMLARCDELESDHERRIAARTQFRGSSLDALLEAASIEDLGVAWDRVEANWHALIGSTSDLDSMRRSVLRLAVQPPPSLSGDWMRTTFGDEITLQRGFDITKKQQLPGPYPVVSSGGILSFHAESACQGPGVIVARKGSVGKVHWVPGEYWPHDTTLWVKDFHGNDPEFVFWFLKDFPFMDYESSTANPSLNRNRLHPIKILWPPKQRQAAIVQQVRQLLGLCDDLDGAIKRRYDTAASLAEALIRA